MRIQNVRKHTFRIELLTNAWPRTHLLLLLFRIPVSTAYTHLVGIEIHNIVYMLYFRRMHTIRRLVIWTGSRMQCRLESRRTSCNVFVVCEASSRFHKLPSASTAAKSNLFEIVRVGCCSNWVRFKSEKPKSQRATLWSNNISIKTDRFLISLECKRIQKREVRSWFSTQINCIQCSHL